MNGRSVLVFGSLHYDILVDAPARPAKGETVTGEGWRPKFGGKGGNQAVAAAGAGARTVMVGAVGGDDFGLAMLANLDRRGVDRRFVSTRAAAPSGMSVAIFDATRDYGAVIVSGANLLLDGSELAAALDDAGAAPIVLLQNEVREAANMAAAQAARASAATIILNAAPARELAPALCDAVDILVVNAIEAAALSGLAAPTSLKEAETVAVSLLGRVPAALVTVGEAGAAYAARDGIRASVEGRAVIVQSTHGAGDAFVGVFAASLARGEPADRALREANAVAASLVATPEADRDSLSGRNAAYS